MTISVGAVHDSGSSRPKTIVTNQSESESE